MALSERLSFLVFQMLQGQNRSQLTQVSNSGSNREAWLESNMGDGSPHTDTSTEMDPDDRNQRVNMKDSVSNNFSVSFAVCERHDKQNLNLILIFGCFLSCLQFDVIPSNPFLASGSGGQQEKFPEQKVILVLLGQVCYFY